MATITQEGVPEAGKQTWNWIAPREWMEPLAGLPHEELTTVKAAARTSRLSEDILYKRMRRGELPFTQIDGIYLIRRSDARTLVPGKTGRPRKARPVSPRPGVANVGDRGDRPESR